MTVSDILDIINGGGVVSLLVLIIVANWKGWFYWSKDYQQVLTEMNFWRKIALESLNTTERSLEIHKKAQQ